MTLYRYILARVCTAVGCCVLLLHLCGPTSLLQRPFGFSGRFGTGRRTTTSINPDPSAMHGVKNSIKNYPVELLITNARVSHSFDSYTKSWNNIQPKRVISLIANITFRSTYFMINYIQVPTRGTMRIINNNQNVITLHGYARGEKKFLVSGPFARDVTRSETLQTATIYHKYSFSNQPLNEGK